MIDVVTAGVRPTAKKRDYASVYFDDIREESTGRAIASAFALEPLCSGLTLTLWSSHKVGIDTAQRSFGWFMPSYSLLWRNDDPAFNKLTQNEIYTTTSRAAARQVCFIMKGKGGKVR